MEFIGLWVLFSVIVGAIANSNGRSGLAWFLIGLLFSPLIGLVFVLIAGKSPDTVRANVQAAAPTESTHVRCSQCYELIMPQARICRHCRVERQPAAHPAIVASEEARIEQLQNAEEMGRELGRIARSPTFWLVTTTVCVLLYLAYIGKLPDI